MNYRGTRFRHTAIYIYIYIYIYPFIQRLPKAFCIESGKRVTHGFEGYEPKLGLLCADAMERATSEPPKGSTAGMGNPFYSEKTQNEIVLKASRPKGLPEQSPASDVAPLHGGRCAASLQG